MPVENNPADSGREQVADVSQLPEGSGLQVLESDAQPTLTACDPAVARAIDVFEKGARKYQNALRELGK
ncbi:MAG TPA: hypothetical protein VFH27_11115 [Longimicrobiaceae bacterium]|nr:hypothetical protein [Longimicrobiaceae bacterium]